MDGKSGDGSAEGTGGGYQGRGQTPAPGAFPNPSSAANLPRPILHFLSESPVAPRTDPNAGQGGPCFRAAKPMRQFSRSRAPSVPALLGGDRARLVDQHSLPGRFIVVKGNHIFRHAR